MAIKILISKDGGKQFDITQSLTFTKWSGDIKSCARKLEFDCFKGIDLPLSSRVILYEDNKKLFDGFVYEFEKNNSGVVSYICYDWCQKLNNINVSYNVKNKYPHEIMEMFLNDYKISKGDIAKGTVKIKKVYLDDSAYDMLQSVYTEQSKKDNKKYMIYAKDNKICVGEKGKVMLKIAFQEANNILTSSFKESLDDMVNRVLIVDENGNKKSEVSNAELIKVHGYFQRVYQIEEGKNSNEQAKSMLNGISRTCNLTGFGDTTCIVGSSVMVWDKSTNMYGKFYIDADSHIWEGESYTVDLDLNFENMMNEVEVGRDEQEENTTSSSSGGSSPSASTSSGDTRGDKVISHAKSKLGCKYVWGATGPNTFDCSGLTMWSHKQVGINIPRTSSQQRGSGKFIKNKSDVKNGDIICFEGHVGLYVGNGQMIHAPNPKEPVKYDPCFSGYWGSRVVAIRRYW